MKKIIDVEFKDSKIIFKIEEKSLFNKKEYNESIDIAKISKIEKIVESGVYKEFTCIVFYQDITELGDINIDAFDEEEKKEVIKEQSILYEIPAFRYTGEIPELFDKITEHLDMNNIEVFETVI